MAYVDYGYYTVTYNGTISEESFNQYEYEAELYLNQYTFNNITSTTVITDGIKRCTCKIIDILYDNSTYADSENKSSESVGDYSVSYINKTEVKKGINKDIKDVVILYFNNHTDSRLLYRGC